MRRNFVIGNTETPFIIPILAIISIIFYSLFPQYSAVAKINNDAKNITNQNKPCDSCDFNYLQGTMVFVQQNSLLSQRRNPSPSFIVEREKQKIIEQNKKARIIPKKKMRVLATAYSSTVDQCDSTPFITANGTHVHDGTLAANFLKFGTKVKFPSLYGDKIFTVEDRMRSNTKVDIWFPTRQEAKNFGAQIVEMEVL